MAKKAQKSLKLVDLKNQRRVTLDTLLQSITQKGIIHMGVMKQKWKSFKGIINPKRLVYFLEKTGTKLSKACTSFLYSVRKDLKLKIEQRPDLVDI
jgi:hypothetical protein